MQSQQQYLKGCLSAIVLQLLKDNGRMYGYEITQRVKDLTAGQMHLTEGALYPTLHKLEAEGILTTENQLVDGRNRKYYKLTENGQKEAQSAFAELSNFLSNLQRILNPQLAY
ncbi:MAG: PadR family transcriptional regulator [Runella sp.]